MPAVLLPWIVATWPSSVAAAVSVRDDTARRITLASPAQRIVSLSPHATELLFAAGAGRQIVAASEYSDYPDAAKILPRIGSYQGIDLERVVALAPDLVVAWQSGNSSGQIEAIERIGIPVFRSEPKTLESIATSLERLGALSGHPVEGANAARAFRSEADALTLKFAGRAPVRVFYQVWNAPLMTIGGRHLISRLIELCGGRNIFSEIEARSSVVDAEAVIAADPEVMVVASPEDVMRGTAPESLRAWQKWPQLSAVRKKLLVTIAPTLITRDTPRILQGAEQLCEAIDRARRD
jgi:iron complex transport system substrate-binding protein